LHAPAELTLVEELQVSTEYEDSGDPQPVLTLSRDSNRYPSVYYADYIVCDILTPICEESNPTVGRP